MVNQDLKLNHGLRQGYTHRRGSQKKYYSQHYARQKGISLFIVVVLIAVISAVVLPMARTTILEEKISQNHNWLNLTYTENLGEVLRQSSPNRVEINDLMQVVPNTMSTMTGSLEDHETEVHYRGIGMPIGASIDRSNAINFDIVTNVDKENTGSFNTQIIGITYHEPPGH